MVDSVSDRLVEQIGDPDPIGALRDHATSTSVRRTSEIAALAEQMHRSVDQRELCVAELVGDAGIGKSWVLSTFLGRVRASAERPMVMAARCVDAEVHLRHAVLRDLLTIGRDDVGDQLAELDELRALIAPGAPDRHIDEAQVGSSVIAVLRGLAAERPLVVALDDVHWCDDESRSALGYALRRAARLPITVVTTRRPGAEGASNWGIRLVPVEIGPLDPAAIAEIVSATAPDLADRVRAEIVRTAGGHPMFAIELARHALRSPTRPGATPRLPSSLDDVVVARLRSRSKDAQLAAALTARCGTLEVGLADRLGLGDALVELEEAEVVTTVHRRVEFTHPLLASVAAGIPTPAEVRRLHRRMAEQLEPGGERTLHRGLGAGGHDEELAAELAAESAAAIESGAVMRGAELATLAVALTPRTSERLPARSVVAARLAHRTGRPDEACRLIDEMLASDRATEDERASALIVRAHVEWASGAGDAATAVLREALALARDPDLVIEAHATLSRVSHDDDVAAARHAERASRLLAERGETNTLRFASALTAVAGTAFRQGRGLDRDAFERAISIEHAADVPLSDSALGTYAALLKYADDLAAARAIFVDLLRLVDDGERLDDYSSVPYILSHLPQLELWAGDWDLAEHYARRHLSAASDAGHDAQVAQARFNLALVHAHRGDGRSAVDTAEGLSRYAAEQGGDPWSERAAAMLQATVACVAGDVDGVVRWAGEAEALSDRVGLVEPGFRRLQGDLGEAMVAIGDVDGAEAFAHRWLEMATRLGRASTTSAMWRVLSDVAAARGDLRAAATCAGAAVDALADTELEVDRCRALLTLGRVERRRKQKAGARRALGAASVGFERMGAQPWLEQCRTELDRAGATPRSTATRAPDDLTPTEATIAELASQGRTTKEIAAQTFLAPKTVEHNLTRIYRKTRTRNRAELARWHANVRTHDGG